MGLINEIRDKMKELLKRDLKIGIFIGNAQKKH
jgi:hypothetical protein